MKEQSVELCDMFNRFSFEIGHQNVFSRIAEGQEEQNLNGWVSQRKETKTTYALVLRSSEDPGDVRTSIEWRCYHCAQADVLNSWKFFLTKKKLT